MRFNIVRYYKKEIPGAPIVLRNRRHAPFKASKAGVDILATNNPSLLEDLDQLIKRRAGGLLEIGEAEYLELRDAAAPPKRRIRRSQEPVGLPSIDQLYVQWKIARGRRVFKPVPTEITTVGRFIHVLERHRQPNPEDEERILKAFWSWSWHYERGMLPCHVWEYPRSAKALGDPRELPYLKDVLAEGLALSTAPDDILVLTNDDTVLHQKVLWAMTAMLSRGVDALSSFRMNFEPHQMPATDTPVAKVRQWGEACLGRDLFAFRAEWLRLNWGAIPDFVLGEAEWDLVLAAMVRMSADVQTTKLNLAIHEPRCELERGYVIHCNHERNWKNGRFAKSEAKIWNNRLAAEFLCDNGYAEVMGRLV